jgi:uncharacterized protein YjbI with pentapeptide repeats
VTTYNKGTLDAYRKIVTKEIVSRSGSFTGLVANVISGSEYQNLSVSAGVASLARSGSANLTGRVYLTGSGNAVLSQTGQIITVSGSETTTTYVAASGSTELSGRIYITGSGMAFASQSGQVITISGSPTTSGVDQLSASGSEPLIGSIYLAGTSPNIINSQTGQVIEFTLSNNVTVDRITGSILVSGSTVQGKDAFFTNLTATNVTGSTILSGASIFGKDATIANVNATNVTGSNIVSGSTVYGNDIIATNVIGTYVTGSTQISGSLVLATDVVASTLSGSTISGSAYQGNLVTSLAYSGSANLVNDIYLTGSAGVYVSQTGQIIDISGSQNANTLEGYTVAQIQDHSPLAHADSHLPAGGDTLALYKSQISDINDLTLTAPNLSITGSDISSISGSLIVTGSISGSDYYGPAMHVQTGSATIYGRRIINFTDAGGMIISMTDDGANDRVTIAMQASGSGGGSLADSVVGSHVYSQVDTYGIAADASRSDHVHGTPGLYETAATDIATAGAAGTSASGSHGDHVHRGILSVAVSGSSELYKNIYVSGAGTLSVTGSGQVITFSGSTGPTFDSVIATYITGSTILSGATIYGTNVIADKITGSTFSGSSYIGGTVNVTDLTAVHVTGSTYVSGSIFYGKDAFITNIVATNVTGSTVSGSIGIFTNAYVSYLSGSNTVSGSTVVASTLQSPVANLTNVYATNVTGSGTLSGSTVRATTLAVAGNVACLGNISGSSFSGSTTVDARANTGTTFKRHRLNFVQGTNMSIVAADDSVSDEIDVTFTAGTGIGTYYGFLTISAFETSGSVTHGIGTTPPAGRICIMPTDDLGGRYYWISQTGSTTFALTMSSADFSDHIIGWSYN